MNIGTGEKVKVSKEVAEAIEAFRRSRTSNELILHFVLIDDCSPNDTRILKYKIKFDDLVGALYNGYEVEKSPKEKAISFLDGIGAQYRGGYNTEEVVKELMNIFGIKEE